MTKLNYIEKAKQKHQTYLDAGYHCSDIINGEDFSSFTSKKDGLYRNHKFSESEVSITIIDDIQPVIDQPIVDQEYINKSVEPIDKKTRIKKTSRRSTKEKKDGNS